MKASELIHRGLYKVGDEVVIFNILNGYLYKQEGNHSRFFGKVYADSETGKLEVLLDNGVWEELKPIPLTAEILEKNGWKWRKKGVIKSLHLYDKEGHSIMTLTYGNIITVGGHEVKIRYVHELQYALRLCGRNELADNFKV